MTRTALVIRNELFIATATVAAHSNAQGGTFRQRDVRFFVELFSNWTAFSAREALMLQNTQLSRYLDALAQAGYARRSEARQTPKYRLSRLGLIELLTRITNPNQLERKEQIFFLLYFIKNYRERLLDLVKLEGAQFPSSLRVEIDALLDTRAILASAVSRCEQELAQLHERISAAESTANLVRRRCGTGTSFAEVVREVEEKFPYELNSEKPLPELLGQIPPPQQRWELEFGTTCRVSEIWRPLQATLKVHLSELKRIQHETAQ